MECDKIPGLPVRTGAWHGGFGGHPVGAEIDKGFLVIASGRRRYRGLLSMARDGIVSGIMVGAVIPFLANKAAHMLTNRILGRTAELTLTPLFFYGGIFFAGGVVLLIIYNVVRSRRR